MTKIEWADKLYQQKKNVFVFSGIFKDKPVSKLPSKIVKGKKMARGIFQYHTEWKQFFE